jgi:hypothetical protein
MLSDLLIKLKSQLLLTEQSGVVIFGSLAIVLQGVALGRPIDDLDIFASEEAFEKLAKRFQIQFKDGTDGAKVAYLKPLPDEKIEILRSFPGVTFEDVAARASTTAASEGFLVGSLDDLTKWKITQGREKDLNDIAKAPAGARRGHGKGIGDCRRPGPDRRLFRSRIVMMGPALDLERRLRDHQLGAASFHAT